MPHGKIRWEWVWQVSGRIDLQALITNSSKRRLQICLIATSAIYAHDERGQEGLWEVEVEK